MKGVAFKIDIIQNVTKVFDDIKTKVTRVNSTFQKTNSKIEALPHSITGLNEKLEILKEKQSKAFTIEGIKHYRREIDKTERELKNLNKTAAGGSGLKKLFGGIGGQIAGMAGAYVGVSAITRGISSTFKAVGNYQQLNVAFTTMLGSAEKAKSVIKDLTQFSNVTPFRPEQVNQAGRSLLAFGFTSKQLIPTLRQIGDISAGTGKDFNELATIFGKAKIAGTLYAEDINQLIDAGIPIIEEFSKQLGVPTSYVKKLASQGKISFGMLEKAFSDMTSQGGKFGGLMEKQSQTLSGRWSTLVGKFNQIKIEIGQALMPIFEAFVNYGLKAGEWLSKMFEGVSAAIQGTAIEAGKATGIMKIAFNITSFIKENIGLINTLVAIISTAVIGYKIWTAAQWALNIAMDANPVGLIVMGVGALITGIVLLVKNMHKITAWFKGLSQGKKALVGIVAAMSPVITALIALAYTIRKIIDNWDTIKKKITEVFMKIRGFIAGVQAVIGMIARNIVNILEPVLMWIRTSANSIKDFILSSFMKIRNFIVSAIVTIKNWFVRLLTSIVRIFNSIKTFILNIFNKLKNSKIYEKLIAPFVKVKDFVVNMFQSIFAFIISKFSFIGKIAEKLGLDKIAEVFKAASSTVNVVTKASGKTIKKESKTTSVTSRSTEGTTEVGSDISTGALPPLPSGNSPQIVGNVQGSGIKNINITIENLVKEVTNYFRDTDTIEDAEGFMDKIVRALESVVNDVNYAGG